MDVEKLLNDIDDVMNNDVMKDDKFIKPNNDQNIKSCTSTKNNKQESSELFNEIESFLNDSNINTDDEDDINMDNQKRQISLPLSTKKCKGLRLISNENINKYCSNILCLNCDHTILIFNNYRWDESVNYLFFRLNFPNKHKLSQKLIKDENYTCYSCQCQYLNINITRNNNNNNNMNKINEWQCCGH